MPRDENRPGAQEERSRHTSALCAARTLLLPPKAVIGAAVPGICALMAWVFLLGNERHPLSYAAYAASAYLFTVLCIWIARESPVRGAGALVRRNPVGDRLLSDVDFRRRVLVMAGVLTDVLWAIGNLVLGICWLSVWFITLGAYYLIFGILRGILLSKLRKREGCTLTEQARTVRCCGIMLVTSVLVLSGIVTLVMVGEGAVRYDQTVVIAVATFTFYSLVSAIVGFVRLRSHENMLVVMNCRVNLAIALVSLFTLEIGMFSAYATADDAQLTFVLPIITGAAIAVALCTMGVISVLQANRVLNRRNSENG